MIKITNADIKVGVSSPKLSEDLLLQVNLCQKLFSKTISVHNMFSPCSAKIRASDKDLPVKTNPQIASAKKHLLLCPHALS